jgi:DNA-binding XRE family transcriptional regulator
MGGVRGVTDPGEMELRDTRRDDPARFLRELRELRSHAGLGQAELAARAHYPCDVIKAAEAGPSLPSLPLLSAYVRGCGGIVPEWEERWRAVTGSPASPLLTARGAGWSEASDAGARVGAEPFAPDDQDPDRVMAALNRVADGMAAAASSSSSGPAADVWTPARPARPPAPAAPAAANTDVWTPAAPAAPAAADADVWSPTAPAASAAPASTDVWRPAAPTGADAALTAATAQPAQPHQPFAAWRALAVYSAITLLLLVILIALFS